MGGDQARPDTDDQDDDDSASDKSSRIMAKIRDYKNE